MTKRGQISIYIILGVILLLVIGTITYLFVNFSKNSSDITNGVGLDTSVSSEALPFKKFVEQCASDVLWEAVQLAGMNGGIIYPDELGLQFNYYDQAGSDGLQVFPEGGIKIPYWLHIQGDEECEFGCEKIVAVPSLEGDAPATIETQIETYINRNIGECINDAERINSLGIDYASLSPPDAKVDFSSNEVLITLYQNFALQIGNEPYDVNVFQAQVEIPFRQYYNDALFLAATLDQSNLLETATIHLISAYSGMSNDLLPPRSGSTTDFASTLFWIAPEVEEKLKNILIANIPLLTLDTSRNYHPVEKVYDSKYYPIKKQFYNQFILPAPEEFSKYNVDFQYSGWDAYLRINDGRQFIQPESFSIDFWPWFGVNRLRTMYSVSYPVMISLKNPDDTAPGGEGFVFNFVTEVNVRNNAPMNDTYESFDYNQFDNLLPDETYFCDATMRTSKNVSLTVKNGQTYLGEPNVSLTFTCGDENCPVGFTDKNGFFNGSLPICSGGALQLLKPDFETAFVKVSPNIDSEIDLGSIMYEPYRYKNITMKKYLMKKIGGKWTLYDVPVYLDDNEIAIVQLTRVVEEKNNVIRDEFSTVAVFNGSQEVEVKLLPGIYEGTIMDVYMNELRIPPQERCSGGSLFTSETCYYVPDEMIILDQYPGGGATFSEETGYLTFNKMNMDAANKIILFDIFADLPGIPSYQRVIEDLQPMGNIDEYSAKHNGRLQPKYE